MAFRFFRRVHLAPGLSLNLSKSGPSVSVGVCGAHATFGPRGIRQTVGIPGTGAFFTSQQGWHSGAHTAEHFADATPAPTPPRTGWQQAGHVLAVAVEAVGLAALAILAALAALLSLSGSSDHHHRR